MDIGSTPANTGEDLRLKALSNAALRALASRRASLPSLEKAALLRLKGPSRYDPYLRDIVEQLNALRDVVGDLVQDEFFDQQVPRAEEVRVAPCQTSPERTLTSILRASKRVAEYIDAVLQVRKAPQTKEAKKSRSAAA